jgi:putative addiction module killer protein
MFTVERTAAFGDWLDGLKDRRAVARILGRIERVKAGNLGDAKAVGDSLSELRIDYGPDYRVYFIRSGKSVIVLLCDGDKSTQDRDIRAAKALAKAWRT